jgi:hypothetical protein
MTSTPAIEPELYHTGLVVDDLDAAMEAMTRIFGVLWAEPQIVASPLATTAGVLFRSSRFTYSVNGEHRIELIQQLDNTAYAAVPGGPRVHHLGFWAHDMAASVDRLEQLGLPSVVHGIGEDGEPAQLSFHRDPHSGLWFELIDANVRPAMERWWAGGELQP